MKTPTLALAALAAALAIAPAAQAAELDPPVHVEVVQCVTDPCPPVVWCSPKDSGGVVRYEVFHDCSARVSVDIIDCLWNERWVEHKAGPVTVRYTTCSGPDASSAATADPFPTCVTEPCGPSVPVPGGCDLRRATPTSLPLPAPVYVNPQALVWGSDPMDCRIEVEPIGACVPPSGRTIEKDVLFVRVILLLCGGNPPPIWS